MWNISPDTLSNSPRGDWVRLRTLIGLRWMAIVGQSVAVLFATLVLQLDLRLDLSAIAIGVSVAFNLIVTFVNPESKRLTERGTMLTLLFDIGQLAALLYLTGGLGNPFSVLILAPVIISATALSLRPTIVVGIVAIAAITALVFFNLPLQSHAGPVLAPSPLFLYGTWVALVIGILFVGGYARRVTSETFSVSQALLATQMALGREQQLTALGGVVAAAAHELGTPLATIKLTSAELSAELADRPALAEDAQLIRSQADRCDDILRDMGRAGKDDLYLHTLPLLELVMQAAEPHSDRGTRVILRVNGVPPEASAVPQPLVRRQAEIIHGLRNLVQNAVDFAASTAWIDIEFSAQVVRIVIADDGPGYPPELLGRIGEPYLRRRPARREYEGMGLGVFIAKTLLERTGAELTFANGSDISRGGSAPVTKAGKPARATGAVVEVRWPRDKLEVPLSEARAPLGRNVKIIG